MKVDKPFVRDPYNYDRRKASLESAVYNTKPSKTQKHQKEEANINNIVKRFGLTGQLPQNVKPPKYGDYSGITDYHTALNAVRRADEAFMQYPAEIRERFKNDTSVFVDFMLDEKNRDEAEKLGLLPKSVKEPVKKAEEPKKPAEPVATA